MPLQPRGLGNCLGAQCNNEDFFDPKLEQGLEIYPLCWGKPWCRAAEGALLREWNSGPGRLRVRRGVDAPCRRQFNARSLQVWPQPGTKHGAVQTPSRGRCTKSRLPRHQLWVSWCPGLEELCQASLQRESKNRREKRPACKAWDRPILGSPRTSPKLIH